MSDSSVAQRLRVGMSLSAHYEVEADARSGLRDTMEQVELAELAGLDSILIGHHYLTRSQFLQPLSVAAYLAARTERIRIGFGVYLLPLVNPVALAEELATIDVLSGGRLIAGFGSGYRSVEYRAMGVPYDERFRRLEEYVSVVRALWSGESVTMSGSFGELEDAKIFLRPVQPGGPPIWLGAFGSVGMRRVARLDASWAVAPNGDLDEVTNRMTAFRDTLREYDRSLDRDYPLLREGCVAGTTPLAAEAARPFLAEQYANYRGWDHGASIEELISGQAVVGDPKAVIERLSRYARMGYTDVILRLQWTGMPQRDVLRSIRLLGEEVLPALDSVEVETLV
ncbi:alkanesulfonate monooxygenase SsuD/methylene tetrahydromethanopterin reductase-like flavin-dependent oxidoreductase (luciferase family) [Arthrobacter ginsengisoli]|uniref:Alkanesulfonate monooxygenase SsuD/methylene tetrahydromethanopterin reductase-like flavin-dependent oxidoreductase (Luciferase family) n=1 Tax=Arthrobacter ginsengisoli TaxID=1356565 RepID=A0ABU1UI66_9MICC|nr:LLM class flavin-dependent oxidoreductase [Arthrobacter ginsengisoli]MDR7084836.1 alkanesulfonate monooxygenase SsuD/methylene tetrahydromethanopterin reductase-like flavin-dependent oxidoreductase (luciferase family) [Arthrobacter ginsengisoli]